MEAQFQRPSLLRPASIQLTGYKLNESTHSEDQPKTSQWLSDTVELLEKPEGASVIVDTEFIRRVDADQWSGLLEEFNRSSKTGRLPAEWQIDLRQLDLHTQDHTTTVQHIQALLDSCKQGNGGYIRKVAVFGLKSNYENMLSILPSSIIELQLFFDEEGAEIIGQDADEDLDIVRHKRVEMMLQRYVAPLAGLNTLSIRYDENAGDLLPMSGDALASLISCPGILKIELERCALSTDNGGENVGDNDTSEQKVFQALSNNHSLLVLRMRSGSLETQLGESIARAIEVGNRCLRYVDVGDMGVSEDIVGAISKAIMRNGQLAGVDLNLNSIQEFHFLSLSNLTCMDVSDNYLGDNGALKLAQVSEIFFRDQVWACIMRQLGLMLKHVLNQSFLDQS